LVRWCNRRIIGQAGVKIAVLPGADNRPHLHSAILGAARQCCGGIPRALPLARAQYNTGTLLAVALQTALVAATAAGAAVAFDASLGTLTFTAPSGWLYQFPLERELRDPNWRTAYWDSAPNAPNYDLTNPRSLNAQLMFSPPRRCGTAP
jgi:hypothetical protein